MKKSPFGLDTIELTKRYRQHKNDMNHISNDQYKSFDEKSFEIRSKKLRFHKSLNEKELDYIHTLVMSDLGYEEDII